MKHKCVTGLALAVLVLALGTASGATVLYDDNFDSYNAGDLMSNGTGWSQSGDIRFEAAPLSGSGFPATGNYINGGNASSNTTATYATGLLNSGVVTLSADIKFTGSNWSSFGFRNDANPSSIGTTSVLFQNAPYKSPDGTTTWFYSDWAYAGSGADAGRGLPLPGFWYDPGTTGWHGEIVLDFINHQIKGTLTNIADYLNPAGYTQTTGWLPMYDYNGLQNELYAPNQLILYTTGTGVQVDNVRLTQVVPEPASLVGLFAGCAGLIGTGYRRYRRSA